AITDDRLDNAFRGFRLIAEEFRGADPLVQLKPELLRRLFARAGPGGTGSGPLTLHGLFIAGDIHGPALPAQDVLGKVERKAEGVIEPEGDFARQGSSLGKLAGLLLQEAKPPDKHVLEAVFLQLQRFLDQDRKSTRLNSSHVKISYA